MAVFYPGSLLQYLRHYVSLRKLTGIIMCIFCAPSLLNAQKERPCFNGPVLLDSLIRIDSDSIYTVEVKAERIRDLRLMILRCTASEDSIIAISYNMEAIRVYQAGRVDKAFELAREGIEKVKFKPYAVTSLLAYNAAFFAQEIDNQHEAAYYFTLAGQVFQSPQLKSSSYKYAADSHFFLGDYEEAIKNAQSGLAAVLNTNNYYELADIYNILGLNLYHLERYSAAREAYKNARLYYEKMLTTGRPRDYRFEWALLLNQGNLFVKTERYKEATAMYEASAQSALSDRDYQRQIVALMNIGGNYQLGLGQTDKAISAYQTAAALVEKYFKGSENASFATLYGNLGESLFLKGRQEESMRMFKKALLLYERKGQMDLAFISQKDNLVTIYKDYVFALLQLFKKEGRREYLTQALVLSAKADKVIDYMRKEQRGHVSKLFWRRNTRDMYEKAIEACFLANDTEKANYFFEKSRAALLNDQLNELNAAASLAPVEYDAENRLKSKIKSLQEKVSQSSGDDAAAADMRRQLFAAQQQLDSFIKSLEKTNPLYYAYKYDNKVPSISDLRGGILKDGQTFLSYFVGDSAVYGLAVGPGKTALKRLDLQQYNLLTNTFQRLISDRNTQNSNFGEYLRVSSALYKLLITPFEIPEGARLVISPDGSFLPFSALSRSESHPDFLVNHLAISYTYSAVVLGKMQRKNKGSWLSPRFFGMAPVHFAPSLDQAALTGSEQALRNIDRYFFRSRIVTGPEASRSEFVTSSPGYRIVQLFTHASADSSGSVPTLYFADSTLRLNELSLPPNPLTELLILSACQTGVGKNQRGEGVFSLARGFAGLGIPSVLTTLWSVENEPVYQITQHLYDQISDDVPLDIALQSAQKQWLQTASRHGQLPYAWAGMVIVGNTEPVGTGIPPGRIWLFAVLILAVAVGIYMVRGRRISVRR